MSKFKSFISLAISFTLCISMGACSDNTPNNSSSGDSAPAASSPQNPSSDSSGSDTTGGDLTIPTIDEINLGEDYTDLTASIRVLTNRTDLINDTFPNYISEFNKLYPNISIEYEGATNYDEDMTIRVLTPDWGDLCMIPSTIDKNELPNFFTPFGSTDSIGKIYNYINDSAYQEIVYGIPATGAARGIVYNRKVFDEAGITETPKTPEEFFDAMQKIKDNTDVIAPLYTNFAAGWTMGAWDDYISGAATGDPEFKNYTLLHSSNPFSDRGDFTGPYAVYYVLYESVARGLTEDDPTTTDWEGSKSMLNNGEIGCMVLGSWSIPQIQEAGPNIDDIAYMPFPISVNGKQYASAGPDYRYGINKNASAENQIASMLYVKWLTEKSNFSYDQGGLPVDKNGELPPLLKAFDGVDFIEDTPAPPEEDGLFDIVNRESEVSINNDNYHVSEVLEAALTGSKTLDEITDNWNAKWTKAQEDNNVEIY